MWISINKPATTTTQSTSDTSMPTIKDTLQAGLERDKILKPLSIGVLTILDAGWQNMVIGLVMGVGRSLSGLAHSELKLKHCW
nr:hypothetical protein [Aeromonas hydrophila]